MSFVPARLDVNVNNSAVSGSAVGVGVGSLVATGGQSLMGVQSLYLWVAVLRLVLPLVEEQLQLGYLLKLPLPIL